MPDTVLELEVPARFPQVAALRRAADGFLHESTDNHLRHTLLLVISELCTNAIEALQGQRGQLTLRVRDLDACVVIEVEDAGPGFPTGDGRRGSDTDDERGRGLQVVRALVDDLTVERRHGCTTVRCTVDKARYR